MAEPSDEHWQKHSVFGMDVMYGVVMMRHRDLTLRHRELRRKSDS
jgi:hypothetical protein